VNGPRTKGDTELAWQAIKRAITAKVNYEAQEWRARQLNTQLDEAWKIFKASLDKDILLGPGKDKFASLPAVSDPVDAATGESFTHGS
jgi:hypothetical protein